jgi:phenylalanine-4-hydroxylase
LLTVEIYELAKLGNESDLANKCFAHLESINQDRPEVGRLIDDGLEIINQKISI